MNDKVKVIDVEGRTFHVTKMSPKTSIKVVKMLGAKVLPFLDSLPIDKLMGGNENGAENSTDLMGSVDDFLQDLDLYKIATALDAIDDETIDKLIDCGLSHCFEPLSAGNARVLNQDGTYGVQGIDDDIVITVRLTLEAITWSVASFFQGNRWGSMFQSVGAMFQPSAKM